MAHKFVGKFLETWDVLACVLTAGGTEPGINWGSTVETVTGHRGM